MPPSVPPRDGTATHRQTRSGNQTRFVVRVVTALRVNRPMILTARPVVVVSKHLQCDASDGTARGCPGPLVSSSLQGSPTVTWLTGCLGAGALVPAVEAGGGVATTRARYPWLLTAAFAATCVSATGFGCWSGGTLALAVLCAVGFLMVRRLRGLNCVSACCPVRGSIPCPS
jgi:hypothetical protein